MYNWQERAVSSHLLTEWYVRIQSTQMRRRKGSFLYQQMLVIKNPLPKNPKQTPWFPGKHFHFVFVLRTYHLYVLFLIYQLLVLHFQEKPYPISQTSPKKVLGEKSFLLDECFGRNNFAKWYPYLNNFGTKQ